VQDGKDHMSDQLAVIEAHTLNCRRRSPMWCVSFEIEIQAIKIIVSPGSPQAAGRNDEVIVTTNRRNRSSHGPINSLRPAPKLFHDRALSA
jgi:hypothetical protein